jgi:hypothetical protein
MLIDARYGSRCCSCGASIAQGDRCHYNPRVTRGRKIRCVSCGGSAARSSRAHATAATSPPHAQPSTTSTPAAATTTPTAGFGTRELGNLAATIAFLCLTGWGLFGSSEEATKRNSSSTPVTSFLHPSPAGNAAYDARATETNAGTVAPAPAPVVPSYGYGSYYDPSYRPPVGEHLVSGYVGRDGTYVAPHYRTNRDDSFWNNWSSYGNVNPHTGRGGRRLPRGGTGGSTYVTGYFKSDGTYVRGHSRRR